MTEKKQSVYASIADDIISKIKSGTYKTGTLLPPERELMKIYSVQRTTIRRGLEILSSNGYIQKAAGLGSVVKSKVACKVDKETKPAITKDIEKTSFANLSLLIGSPSSKVNPDSLPKALLDIIVALNKNAQNSIYYNQDTLPKGTDALISIEREQDKNTNAATVCVLSQSDDHRSVILDSDKAAYYGLTYLEELGHINFAYIGTDSALSFQNAFYNSFSVCNSTFDEELVNLAGIDEKSGFDGFSELFRKNGSKFTAIITANDDVARGVLKAAKYYKIKVPEELSVLSLCSTDKDAEHDRIYFDTESLAQEILLSLEHYDRIACVLFSGNLIKGKTAGEINSSKTDGKNISSFLL